MIARGFLAAALLALSAPLAAGQGEVRPERIRADMEFLAGKELRGRASATRDEAIAAAYVASQFRMAGLQPAPGMDGFLQRATVIRPRLAGTITLTAGGNRVRSVVPLAVDGDVSGRLTVVDSPDAIPDGAEVVLLTREIENIGTLRRAAAAKRVRLVLAPETIAAWRLRAQSGDGPRIAMAIEGVDAPFHTSLAVLSALDVLALKELEGETVSLAVPLDRSERAITTNVIGYLPGRDPALGLVMLGAHLDHEGVRDGVVHPGANDDASGTAAVMELARALSEGRKLRRGMLFVAFGSEELGLLGARYFAEHPPVPLDRIAANLGFELVGRADPNLPPGTMMMTGYGRSDFGPKLAAAGALVAPDPYPQFNFFERSDNYALAQRGIVAHVLSGWATEPNYHTPQDTLDSIDLGFMARAVGSLVGPLRRTADSRAAPQWNPGGRPPAD